MKKIIALVLTLSIIGCGPKIDKSKIWDNMVIGLVANYDDDKVCYGYTGFTVFGNNEREYIKDYKTEEQVKKVFSTLSKLHKHTFVYLDESILKNIDKSFSFSSWDGKGRAIDGKTIDLEATLKRRKIDLLVIKTNSSERNCNINYRTSFDNKRGVVFGTSSLAVFKADGLEWVGSFPVMEAVQVKYEPAKLDNLTEKELMALKIHVETGINRGVSSFFSEIKK